MTRTFSRRRLLAGAGATIAATMGEVGAPAATGAGPGPDRAFRYCLNTALLRGYDLDIVEQVELAGEAGYDAVEPWLADLERFEASGGALDDLARRIEDLGLSVESAIGFAPWIADDPAERERALEQARRDMDRVSRIGGRRIAAPPAGEPRGAALDLGVVADRYRGLLEVGAQCGVVPQLELWGFARNLSRLAECVFAAVAADHEDACLLLDVYHLYKGGSGLKGLRLLGPHAVHVLHVNDYPSIPRETIEDKDRVLPGEGVAPLRGILGALRESGGETVLSIELFNEGYWKRWDAPTLARLGLERTKAATVALD
jgi:2-keto-myo-inositol isomerase